METVITGYNSDISHIATDGKTRCNRQLKHYVEGEMYNSRQCTKCGESADFDRVHLLVRDMQQRNRQEEQARRERIRIQQEQDLLEHRQLMQDLSSHISQMPIDNFEYDEKAAGGTIKFTFDGFQFTLGGHIHNRVTKVA